MPTKQLYNIRIPQDTQTNAGSQGLGRQLESLSSSGINQAIVEALGPQSGEHTISASYAHQHAEKVATELEELLQAGGYEYLPYYNPSTGQGEYIVVEDGSVQKASVHEDRVQVVEGSFTPKGTSESHRRSIRVNPVDLSNRNPWSSTNAAYVAIPSTAKHRTWYDRETQAHAAVSVVETRTGELTDVDIIDATTPSLSSRYHLVYDVDYNDIYQAGVVLWDSRGHANRDDADGQPQYAKCYAANHEFEGTAIIDTGVHRYILDTTNGLRYSVYDAGNWTGGSLPASDWALADVDIKTITPLSVEAHLTFTNPTTSPTSRYPVVLLAARGADSATILQPPSVNTGIPTGLQNHLDPIAATQGWIPQATPELLKRDEITPGAIV